MIMKIKKCFSVIFYYLSLYFVFQEEEPRDTQCRYVQGLALHWDQLCHGDYKFLCAKHGIMCYILERAPYCFYQ